MPVQKWYEDIMSTLWNEILYKAKIFLTAESKLENFYNMLKFFHYYDFILFQGSLEEIVEKHDVSFNASLFMKVLSTVKCYFSVMVGQQSGIHELF